MRQWRAAAVLLPAHQEAWTICNGWHFGTSGSLSLRLLHLELGLPIWHELGISQDVLEPALLPKALLQLSPIQQIFH